VELQSTDRIAMNTRPRDGSEREGVIQLELTEQKMVRLAREEVVSLLLESTGSLLPSCQPDPQSL
jgi:hypothetical protein